MNKFVFMTSPVRLIVARDRRPTSDSFRNIDIIWQIRNPSTCTHKRSRFKHDNTVRKYKRMLFCLYIHGKTRGILENMYRAGSFFLTCILWLGKHLRLHSFSDVKMQKMILLLVIFSIYCIHFGNADLRQNIQLSCGKNTKSRKH